MSKRKQSTEERIGTLHFTIDGEWFTWLLRHLWIEGNQMKAVKMWATSFPEYNTPKILRTWFLDLVAGRKKFIGDSSGENGFEYVDDGVKHWSPARGEKPNPSFPLLDSWEDVIRLKKAQLFLKELELRAFRLKREYPDNFIACNYNASTWTDSVAENRIENNIRTQVNDLYTDTRNLSYQLLVDVKLDQLPTEVGLLRAASGLKGGKEFRDLDKKIERQNYNAFIGVKAKLDTVKDYFIKKYGTTIFSYNEAELESIYSFESRVYTVEETEKSLKKSGYSTEADTQDVLKNIETLTGIKVPNVEDYVQSLIEESHREKIEAEDAKTTSYTSGYINTEGDFFGCTDLLHEQFAATLCEQFHIDTERKKSSPRSLLEGINDPGNALDEEGWVKVSMNRFFYVQNLTQAQIDTMFDYMQGKEMSKAMFNTVSPNEMKTLDEVTEK